MSGRDCCVYSLADGLNRTLYVGVTPDLPARLVQHREGRFDGFTKRYGIRRLVYFEITETMSAATQRVSNSSVGAGTGNAI